VTGAPWKPALLRGGCFVAAGAIGARLFQALGWFLLARMLAPADVGALTVAAVFVNALALLPGLGLGTALLARREDPRPLARSALTVALLGGAVLVGVAAGVGELVGRSRGEEVGRIVAVLGGSLLFQGAASVAGALLDRSLRFERRALADVAGGVVFVLVAVGSAAAGARSLAPALGLVASAAVTAMVACCGARLLPTLRPDFAALRASARVGLLVLATALLQWLFVSADVWIVERRFGREAVGCYGIALQLALLPATTIGLFVGRLALPAIAHARAVGGTASVGFVRAVRIALLLATTATVVLGVAARPLVETLYGDHFTGATRLVRPLAIYGLARVLGGLAGPALLATGRARVALLLVLLQDVVAIPVAWLLPAELGARGTAVTFAAATVVAGVIALRLGLRELHASERPAGPEPAASAASPAAAASEAPLPAGPIGEGGLA